MQPLESLAKVYSKDIKEELFRFGLDIRVAEHIEQRPAAAFDNALLLGEHGYNDDVVAILASSENTLYNGLPIHYMFIPEHPAGCLLVAKDKTAVAVDFFYIIEGGVIKAIHTTEPVQLDGLELRIDLPYGNAARWRIPESVFITAPATQNLTNSKYRTNIVLKIGGIPVPRQNVLRPGNGVDRITEGQLRTDLDELSINRFVLKGDGGLGGEYVHMFGRHELEKACNYTSWLQKNNRKILLEERIMPLQWKDENDQHIDWNIRAFVTLSEDPQWIDAIVRYNVLGGSPVNICQGACVEELEKTVARTHASKKRIVDTALEVARVVYNYIKNCGETPSGFLGLDLIVSEKGIYTIEVNSAGSGGFAELLEIRKKPLASVRYLLESMGPVLEQNRAQRTSRQYKGTPHSFKRIPNTCEDYLALAETFYHNRETYNAAINMYEKVLTLNELVSLSRYTDQIVALLKLHKEVTPLYITTRQYEKAYAHFKAIMRLNRRLTVISSETALSATFEKEYDGIAQLLHLGAVYERR